MSERELIEFRIRIWREKWQQHLSKPQNNSGFEAVLDGLVGLFYWKTIYDLERLL